MRLLVDAGNTRLKWQLESRGEVVQQGFGVLDAADPLPGLSCQPGAVSRVAISTVASEEKQKVFLANLAGRITASVHFFWAESARGGLVNAYSEPRRMGADRWHAMYAAWCDHRNGVAVVDAGSAVTVDYVGAGGVHLGGFILPGLHMMFRSLRTDAARIGFDPEQLLTTSPGASTGECANHGLAWLSAAMVERVHLDARRYGLQEILVTGGDADRLLGLGLSAVHRPSLVMEGLALIDEEESGR